jgi:GH24 family phage-related lysozyme (muramidase)
LTGDSGAGSELGALQKTALSGDAGAARDAMKSLIKTAGSASDMRLSGRRGQEKIVSGQERTPSKQIKKPSKGVNL